MFKKQIRLLLIMIFSFASIFSGLYLASKSDTLDSAIAYTILCICIVMLGSFIEK